MEDSDINLEAEIKKLQEKRARSGTAFGLAANSEFNMFEDDDNMLKEIDFNEDEADVVPEKFKMMSSYSAPKAILDDVIAGKDDFDDIPSRKIADREDSYRRRWRNRTLLPVVEDPFAKATGKKTSVQGMSYKDILKENELIKEEAALKQEIKKREWEAKENERKEARRKEAEEKKKAEEQLKKEKKRKKAEKRHHKHHHHGSKNRSESSESNDSSDSNDNEPVKKQKTEARVGWKVIVLKEAKTLAQYDLPKGKELHFGKDPSSDVLLENPTCSKVHAKMKLFGSSPELVDLNSTNGTFLNGRRVAPTTHVVLHDRDIVKFGASSREYMLMFVGGSSL